MSLLFKIVPQKQFFFDLPAILRDKGRKNVKNIAYSRY